MQYGIDHFFYRSFSEEGIAFDPGRLSPVLVAGGQTGTLGETAYVGLEIAGRTEENGAEGKDGLLSGQGIAQDGELPEGGSGGMVADRDGLLMREDEQVVVQYHVKSLLDAPVPRGMEVGTVTYLVGDTAYKQERIVTASAVEKIDLAWCLRQVVTRYLLPGGKTSRQNG